MEKTGLLKTLDEVFGGGVHIEVVDEEGDIQAHIFQPSSLTQAQQDQLVKIVKEMEVVSDPAFSPNAIADGVVCGITNIASDEEALAIFEFVKATVRKLREEG